jgi:hypothetical protein
MMSPVVVFTALLDNVPTVEGRLLPASRTLRLAAIFTPVSFQLLRLSTI